MYRKIRVALLVFALAFLFLSPGPAAAEVRGYVDGRGFFRFPGLKRSNPPRMDKPSATVADYEKIIREASGMYRVDTELVKAVIRAESGFNPSAVSRKGALGLMQLMPATVSLLEVDDPFDPVENVLGGTRYLGQLLRRFNGDKILALAAYNAGPEKVELYQGVPPYAETRMYVRKVMEFYRRYTER